MIISLAGGHGCSSKDDISKRIPPKPRSGIGNKVNRYRLEKISRDRDFLPYIHF